MGIRESLAAIDNPFAVSRLCVSPLFVSREGAKKGGCDGQPRLYTTPGLRLSPESDCSGG